MDHQPTAAPAADTTPARAATVEAPGLFAVLEALALAARGPDATKQSAASVDDRPRPGDSP